MKKNCFLLLTILLCCYMETIYGQKKYEEDVIKTSAGDVKMTFIGHGTLMFTYNGKIIYFDPVKMYADFGTMPKADLLMVTHEHFDHFEVQTLDTLTKAGTKLFLTETCEASYKKGSILKNGDTKTVWDIKIEAVPAYNQVHKNKDGNFFHPKGRGNGYILTFGDKRIYVAGDTENTDEMKALKNIDVAFLPMNLPYTMTPEMVADAAKAFKPKILYPYHYGSTNTDELLKLMEGTKDVEVRIRSLK